MNRTNTSTPGKVEFNDLTSKDLAQVLVLWKIEQNKYVRNYPLDLFRAVNSKNGVVWKKISRHGTHYSLVFPGRLAKEMNIYFVDDTRNRSGYSGDWEGKPVPDHLVNLESLAEATERNLC